MRIGILLCILAALLFVVAPTVSPAGESVDKQRRAAEDLAQKGLYKQAWDAYENLLLNRENSGRDHAADLLEAMAVASSLDQWRQAESLLDRLYDERADDWRLLAAVAKALAFHLPHDGYILDGEFHRMGGNDSGRYANAFERDRAKAILMLREAEKHLNIGEGMKLGEDRSEFYSTFAAVIASGRVNDDAWLLTNLTSLDPLPDYADGYSGWRHGGRNRGAPVDADGNPLFHPLPESWDKARNDGQRWRWLLAKMAENRGSYTGSYYRDKADWTYAQFLHGQFGVQTLAGGIPRPASSGIENDSGPFAVRTLVENETIAKLANGSKRFTLPEPHNFIAILRRLIASNTHQNEAIRMLAEIFENRQQYDTSLSFWKKLSDATADPESEAVAAVRRIAGNVGSLEPTLDQPAGSKAKIPYVFRNGQSVKITAYRLDERTFIKAIKARLKSGDHDNMSDISPEAIGRVVAQRGIKKFVIEQAAQWAVPLEPLAGHYSRRIFLEMPFDQAGAYLITAQMENGNLSRVILWQSDLALVAKTLGEEQLYYVADALSGTPEPKATLSFFGFAADNDRQGVRGKPRIITREFAEYSDADGLVLLPNQRFENMAWMTQAETADGRLAYLGFSGVWNMDFEERIDQQIVSYIITDRPVYRPGQTIHYKSWSDRRSYAADATGLPAGTPVKVTIRNPMGEIVQEKSLSTGRYGDVDGSLELGANAPLGMYHIISEGNGWAGSAVFSLEEYKKPEFEVAVESRGDTLALGDAVQIRVSAKYYFGGPVTDAKVNYRITRTVHSVEPFPPSPWDWLYGRGYWWPGYEYHWLPGWKSWGIGPISPERVRFMPPEMVAEGEGKLDADGVFRLTLDTAMAKALYGDQDHRYSITAEVTDQSRRTIVGSESLVAARKPFSVSVWPDRGYYQAGEKISASLMAYTAQGAGVTAKGEATLYRLRFDAKGDSSETKVDSWTLTTDADGRTGLALTASAPGQYRLSCLLTDGKGNREEGAAVFTIHGDRDNPGDFRFASLELVPDRFEYAPGDTLKLAVNAENKKAVVLLFPKAGRGNRQTADAKGGSSSRPLVLRLDNGGQVQNVAITADDQPNFFCEALTIFNGKCYNEVREIFVPPAKKVVNVELAADSEKYIPGGKATFQIKVTDDDDKPVTGQCVVALYDKAVEYISGGSNVGDIREAFWSWKRSYHPQNRVSLQRYGYRANQPGESVWSPLGVFGWMEMDRNEEIVADGDAEMANASGVLYGGAPTAMMDMAVASPVPPAASPAPMLARAQPTAAEQAFAPRQKMAVMTGGGDMAEPAVRREFADTALWLKALELDESGQASFSLDMPDNLTTWKTRVWTKAASARVGENVIEVVTKKNILIRPQMPRFLTQKDQVILSANIHNSLPRAKKVRVELILEGGMLEAADGVATMREFDLAASGEARVDWLVRAVRSGDAVVRMRVLTDEESDAAEQKLPVVIHGSRTVKNLGAVIRPGQDRAAFTINVPRDRLVEQSHLSVSFSPTLASAMLDALPYLVEYPYGCTEQTLNRFLPAVMTRRYLERLGLSLSEADNGTADTPDAASAAWLKKFGDARKGRPENPVFDDAVLETTVKQGVERLTAMQNQDGGWGWFSGLNEQSWPHTTAIVVHGLLTARDNGVAVVPSVVEEGVNWLRRHQADAIGELKRHLQTDGKKGKAKADNMDAFIYMILTRQGYTSPDMRDFLYRDRLDLSLSGLALFGIALHREGATIALTMVLANLGEFVEKNPENHTAWLRLPRNGWWWWYNDEVETLSWYLKLLANTDPKGETTAMVAKYLLENRKNASYWRSTRDTAYAIESLVDFAIASGEATPDMRVALFYDGKKVMERTIGSRNLLEDFTFSLEGVSVEDGQHEIRIERHGGGNLYVAGKLDLFSLEDPIPAVGRDLKITRNYYRLVKDTGSALAETSRGDASRVATRKYRRERMPSPFAEATPVALSSGDLVEVELTIETANDYEYLVFEDMKAAGLEAVNLTSGYDGNPLGAYVEYRDQKVVMFVRTLPRGKHNVSYRFRAETPGVFSALPIFGCGMYATDLFANSEEMKVRIVEKEVFE